MITRKKKHILYYAIALAYGLVTILVIHSCSTDESYFDVLQMNENNTSRSIMSPVNKLNNDNALIDSIANLDEFWQFEMCSELLSDKFQAYTSTLNDEEYNKLMESLNNDDYMEVFIEKANLGKELQLMNEARENLLLHTGFIRLTEEERMLLFRQYAESRGLTAKKNLKTRTEGDTNKCEEQKQAAYAQAKVDYDSAILKCRKESSTYYCYTLASSTYDRNKRAANREYENCLKSQG